MGTRYELRATLSVAAIVLIGFLMTGCGGGSGPRPGAQQNSTTPRPVTTGTGQLTVAVTDIDGRPLAGATVMVRVFGSTLDSVSTGANGVATVDSVPARVEVGAYHEFAGLGWSRPVEVAQDGMTYFEISLEPYRRRPAAALLPVSIQAGSVSDDRSELTLQVEVVASAAAPFPVAQYGDNSESSTPSLSLTLMPRNSSESHFVCSVWLDRTRTTPTCGDFLSLDPFTVSVLEFDYDATGSVPILAEQGPADSAMLLLDESGRVSELDPFGSRSFAARRFITRAVTPAEPQNLSIAAFAGDGRDPPAVALLPEQPLWLPLGSGSAYSSDRSILDAALDMMEPLVGGAAPVFAALGGALAVTASEAPPGNGAIVALLGGGDQSGLSESERRSALTSLQQQRDAAGVQAILIAAASPSQAAERLAIAEVAAALRAPAVSLGLGETWGTGLFSAWDLAADLSHGLPLPSMTGVFRVKASEPDAFPAGEMLYGGVVLDSDQCPMGCGTFPLDFAVMIP